MASFLCDECKLSACRKRCDLVYADQLSAQAPKIVGSDKFAFITKGLNLEEIFHLGCTTCQDDAMYYLFTVGGTPMYIEGADFLIWNHETEEYGVKVLTHPGSKGEVVASKALCRICAVKKDRAYSFNKSEYEKVKAISKKEENKVWESILPPPGIKEDKEATVFRFLKDNQEALNKVKGKAQWKCKDGLVWHDGSGEIQAETKELLSLEEAQELSPAFPKVLEACFFNQAQIPRLPAFKKMLQLEGFSPSKNKVNDLYSYTEYCAVNLQFKYLEAILKKDIKGISWDQGFLWFMEEHSRGEKSLFRYMGEFGRALDKFRDFLKGHGIYSRTMKSAEMEAEVEKYQKGEDAYFFLYHWAKG